MDHFPQLAALIFGWSGVYWTFVLVSVSLIVGLIRARSAFSNYFRWLPKAALGTVGAEVMEFIINKMLTQLGFTEHGVVEWIMNIAFTLLVGYLLGLVMASETEDGDLHQTRNPRGEEGPGRAVAALRA